MYQSRSHDNLHTTLISLTPAPPKFTPSQFNDNLQNPPQNYNSSFKNPGLFSHYDSKNPVKPMFSPKNLPLNNNTHVVTCLPPIKREYYENEFAYVECPNITTMWLKGNGFSYLTKYSNDQNYFFLPLTETGFDLETWDETLTKNKIDKRNLEIFVGEVNYLGRVIENLRKVRKEIRNKSLIFSGLGVLCSVLSIVVFICWINYLLSSKSGFYLISKFLVYMWMLLLVCATAFFIYCFRTLTKSYKNFSISKAMHNNDLVIETIIEKWNNKYFLERDLYVVAPRNLAYLQFVLDSRINFKLENHPFPTDLVKSKNR